MAQVVYAVNALDNIERLLTFLSERSPESSAEALAAISSAVEILSAHPLIGRLVEHDLRELVISFGRTGYIALYEHRPAQGLVVVHAIRHQRELVF